MHAACLGDPPHIVADHVHDHDVFRPVLFGVLQPVCLCSICLRCTAAFKGAFHGTAGDRLAVECKEGFRGGGANEITPGIDIGSMLVLGLCELQKKFPRTCLKIGLQAHGVIDLVRTSLGDVFLDAFDRDAIGITIHVGLPIQLYFGGIRLGERSGARLRVKSEPEIRKRISWMREERRIKCRGSLVAEKPGSMPAMFFHQALDLIQRLRNILEF